MLSQGTITVHCLIPTDYLLAGSHLHSCDLTESQSIAQQGFNQRTAMKTILKNLTSVLAAGRNIPHQMEPCSAEIIALIA